LEDVTPEGVQGLVAAGAQEAYDLDFKRELYGRGDSDKRALAGDVAALANTAGGVIAIGIAEDEQGKATSAPGVEITDAEVGRMLQVVAGLVSPMPTFDVITVLEREPADGGSGLERDDVVELPANPRGFFLIAVPRSPSAPHAVLINEALRYPKRNGSTTRYLSEPEVAAAYRDRLAGATSQRDRLDTVERDAISRLNRDEHPWLVVTLVPDLPGDLVLTTSVFREFEQTILGRVVSIVRLDVQFHRASVGHRRLLADGGVDRSGKRVKWASLEAHTDGAGAYALPLWDLVRDHRREGESISTLINDESIAVALISGLVWLAHHAQERTAAGGNAALRASILGTAGAQSMEIGQARGRGFGESKSRSEVTEPIVSAETTASLQDLAAASSEMVASAASLLDELGQPFGIAEMGQLSRAGEVRVRHWNHEWQPLVVAWAEANGIAVTQEKLP
jgi:hypothetical protein